MYERAGDNAVRQMGSGIAAEGEELIGTWSTQVFDGRAYPSGPNGYAARRTPVDEFTAVADVTQDGVPWRHNTQVFSPDGQRMTIILKDVDGPIIAIAVYDKVADPAR